MPVKDTNITIHSAIRDDFVKTAVSFLKNPKVVNEPLNKKQKFLISKGLTEEEIQKACEIAGVFSEETNLRIPPSLHPMHFFERQIKLTFLDKLKETVHSLAIFSIVGYALYKIYENYIAPYLFCRKKKSVNESIENLEKNLDDSFSILKINLEKIKVDVDKIKQSPDSNTERQLADIKTEISSIKALLLGRKQFPSVSNSPVVPPSIPAWQMASVTDSCDKSEELEEVASGSGSSEQEHCAKTSESSLEIILSPKECDEDKVEEN